MYTSSCLHLSSCFRDIYFLGSGKNSSGQFRMLYKVIRCNPLSIGITKDVKNPNLKKIHMCRTEKISSHLDFDAKSP